MRIGSIHAGAGEHGFGYLEVAGTRSGLNLEIPVHVFVGTEPGPTLLVQGAVHGTEPIGTLAILDFVTRIDPRGMRGSVIAVPVVNRLGFALGQRCCPIDDKDVSCLFPGNPGGSISDQIAHVYFEEVIRKADVMIDFHQGGLTSYERYVLFTEEANPENLSESETIRRKLVVAFGLESAAFFPAGTFDENQSQAIADAGVVQFTVELSGGAGWFCHGEEDVRAGERGIWNTMRAMRMIDGEFESDGPLCTIYNACVVIWKPAIDGLFIREKGPGTLVGDGETYGRVVDPFTGRELTAIRNTREAVVIPGGHEWPALGRTTVGILGVVDEIVDRRTVDLYVRELDGGQECCAGRSGSGRATGQGC